jgi:hypothetical protein
MRCHEYLWSFVACSLIAISSGAYAQQGVWKAYTPPPGTLIGEFGSNDPVGLASGAEIKADCSLSWIDPADDKLYCFSSGTSMQLFLEEPQSYIAQARKAWVRLHPPG